MTGVRARSTGVAALALALSGAIPVGGEERPALPVPLAAAWPESAAAPWRGTPTPVRPVVPPATTLRGIGGGATLAGGAVRSAGVPALAGRLEGMVRLSIATRLALEAHAGLLARDRGEAFDRRATRSGARIRLADGPRSAWLGMAFERGLAEGASRGGPLLSLGGAMRWRGIALGASLEQSVERVRVVERVMVRPPADTLDAQFAAIPATRFGTGTHAVLSGEWGRRRVAIGTVAGVTLNPLAPPRGWWQTSATVALRPRLSLFATLGDPAPRWLAPGAGSERGASLGVRLSSAPAWETAPSPSPPSPAWRLRPLGRGWYVVEIRVAGGGGVQIIGDFTEWQPLDLRRLRGDRWALAVRIPPGVHHVQVRIGEGPWMPPAGLAATADGFSGSAGVFVTE